MLAQGRDERAGMKKAFGLLMSFVYDARAFPSLTTGLVDPAGLNFLG
jgi:hypothetical protein